MVYCSLKDADIKLCDILYHSTKYEWWEISNIFQFHLDCDTIQQFSIDFQCSPCLESIHPLRSTALRQVEWHHTTATITKKGHQIEQVTWIQINLWSIKQSILREVIENPNTDFKTKHFFYFKLASILKQKYQCYVNSKIKWQHLNIHNKFVWHKWYISSEKCEAKNSWETKWFSEIN